jgi:hypothetical protein
VQAGASPVGAANLGKTPVRIRHRPPVGRESGSSSGSGHPLIFCPRRGTADRVGLSRRRQPGQHWGSTGGRCHGLQALKVKHRAFNPTNAGQYRGGLPVLKPPVAHAVEHGPDKTEKPAQIRTGGPPFWPASIKLMHSALTRENTASYRGGPPILSVGSPTAWTPDCQSGDKVEAASIRRATLSLDGLER